MVCEGILNLLAEIYNFLTYRNSFDVVTYYQSHYIAGFVISQISTVTLVIAVAIDLREHLKRPWTHWVGIFVPLWSFPISIAYLVWVLSYLNRYWNTA